jgi:uncharacterized Zn-finger protein
MDEIIEEVVHDHEALEIVFVDQRRVACMGSGGALGHPKTFYTIGDRGYVECGYCDRIFVFDAEKSGEVLRSGKAGNLERDASASQEPLPGDGLTERATPPPGENL